MDLNDLRAVTYYIVDLADDGADDLPGAAARLARVVDRIRALNPATRVLLVGHSYPVLVAAQYVSDLPAADRTARVLGLVALAAPWSPVGVPGSGDVTTAEGLRAVWRPFPAGLSGAVAVGRAIDHLVAGLEATGAAQHGVPHRDPYPTLGSDAGRGLRTSGESRCSRSPEAWVRACRSPSRRDWPPRSARLRRRPAWVAECGSNCPRQPPRAGNRMCG